MIDDLSVALEFVKIKYKKKKKIKLNDLNSTTPPAFQHDLLYLLFLFLPSYQ